MTAHNFFINEEGHLRSGWRFAFFVIAFGVCVQLLSAVSFLAVVLVSHQPFGENLRFVVDAIVLFSSATLIGWACGRLFEELPLGSLGWATHRGWWLNLAIGSVLGFASLMVAAILPMMSQGLRFTFAPANAATIGKTLVMSLIIFVIAAAGEEALFRGYPLQTFVRARLSWLGVLLTSVPFALVHLNNPNVARGFTFINTVLAGVWLAIAYLRTRSLWLPLGLHWSWNWLQASILGLPVSGISLGGAPLLRAINTGPDWLTGGAYGIEGGAACTFALIISTLVVWRTKLIVRAGVPSSPKVQEVDPVRP